MSKDSFDAEWPSLMEDVNASISDTLDLLCAIITDGMSELDKSRLVSACRILKAIADPVREAIAAADEANEDTEG